MGIKVKCKNCNKEADSDSFRLHYKYKTMVCLDCFKGKTEKKEQLDKTRSEAPPKPAGWDKEDEYLEKIYRQKEREKPKFRKIPGTDYIECVCSNCNYFFKYNYLKKMPPNCPYCNAEIPKINTFSIL